MDTIQRENKQCMIMGDMNIDLLKFETHLRINESVILFRESNILFRESDILFRESEIISRESEIKIIHTRS